MRGIFIAAIFSIFFFSVVFFVRHLTHQNHMAVVSKALDQTKVPIVVDTPKNMPDCYSKEYYGLIATDASKKTVDFIVDKMIAYKFIIVNKDGFSYRFKLAKKYKTVVKK